MLARYSNVGLRREGKCGPGRPGPTPSLEHRFDALPRAKHDELQDHHQRETDPAHRRTPFYLHHGELTGLGRGTDTLP